MCVCVCVCVWGYMLKKIRVGRNIFYFFYHFGTLKQNLVKFKYTQAIK